MDDIKLYAGISKYDEELRMVYGYATTEALDSQGEIVSKEAVSEAITDYMKYANIREMHQPSAVGKTKNARIDEKGMYIAAKVVDDKAWTKVKEGVYNGFSIGGRVNVKKGDTITGLTLTEISLVDRPANPEAVFDVWKVDGGNKTSKKETQKVESQVEKAEEQIVKPEDQQPVSAESEQVVKPADEQPVSEEGEVKEVEDITEVVETPEVTEEVKKPEDEQEEEKASDEVVDEQTEPETDKSKTDKKKADTETPMKKSIYDAAGLVGLARQLHSYIVMESYEGESDKMAELKTALETIKRGVIMELQEDEDYPEPMTSAIELAESVLTIEKSDEKTEKVEAIEKQVIQGIMPTDEQITFLLKTLEQEDSQKNRDALKFHYAGRVFDAVQKQIHDNTYGTVEKVGRAISASNGEKISEAMNRLDEAIKQLNTLLQGNDLTDDEKKKLKDGIAAGSERTSQRNIEANAPDQKLDMKTANSEDAALAKVQAEITAVKEQMTKLLNEPLPIKAKASYITIEKGSGADGMSDKHAELEKAENRAEEISQLLKGPHEPQLEKEAQELTMNIMKLRREVNDLRN